MMKNHVASFFFFKFYFLLLLMWFLQVRGMERGSDKWEENGKFYIAGARL
jgi:hypothetical protein